MDGSATGVGFLAMLVHEMTLFAAIGFAIGGAGDVIGDLIWIVRTVWRRATVYRRHQPMTLATLPPADRPGRIAIFVPAWDEAAVIGAMLRNAVASIDGGDWRIYVGLYPNDPKSIAAVAEVNDERIVPVIGPRAGPTTKADCLNALWRRLIEDEAHGAPCKAIVLHDAEDVIHAGEVRLFDQMIERFDQVQIPAMPLPDPQSRWIAGHYIDEFAESHMKTMPMREAIGAGLPSAGVGCAFSRVILGRIAQGRAEPFAADSLTEDYELGLRIGELGGRAAFVRLPERSGQPPVAVRAHFPSDIAAAVRQKSRWIAGISLSGWYRLGWRGGLAERWMRYQDRREIAAAIIVSMAYVAFMGWLLLAGIALATGSAWPAADTPVLDMLLSVCVVLLIWRLAMRAIFVARAYGWREGLRALPRAVVSNIIAIMAARRAIAIYLRHRRHGAVVWDKTAHRFPAGLGNP